MSTPISPTQPTELDRHGAQCPNCGATLAPDQRYCLNCGRRLQEPRVDFHRALSLEPQPPGPPARRSAWDQRATLVTIAAIAAIVVALGVGVVIGRGNGGATVGKSQIITLAGGGTPSPASATSSDTGVANTTVAEDWPSGKSGWTVELSTLPTSATATDVSAAKSAASAKGAAQVGVLNGDNHSGTPSGTYVIYSGDYATQAQAKAAQAKLRKKFPGALVLHVMPSSSGGSSGPVSSAGLQQATAISHLHGSAYTKASAKLPSTIGTGGAPPPVDHKKAGGGSSATCIGC